MEKKSSDKTKPKTKRVRSNFNAPNIESPFLTGDLNGCLLVIPQILQTTKKPVMFDQDGHPEYHL
jgi:hypothetical protein